MVQLARLILIFNAILLAPLYALWVLGGWIADKRAQAKVNQGSPKP